MMYGYGTGLGGGEWLLLLLGGGIILAGIVLLVLAAMRGTSGPGPGQQGTTRPVEDSALKIARERLARGEISSEEYASIRDALS